MEQLYSDSWAGQSCAAVAGQIALIVLAIVVAVLGFCGWLASRSLRRHGRSAKPLVWGLGGIGMVIGGIAAVVLLRSDVVTHSIQLVDGKDLEFRGCRGLSPAFDRVALSEISGAQYQWYWTGGRSPTRVDEIVLSIRGRADAQFIRLSTDPAVMDHALLARIMPRQTIAAYAATLRDRGQEPPAALLAAPARK